MEKDNKKKTLTISSNLKKKIDTTSISTDGKKSFAVKKKEPFRGNKNTNRPNQNLNTTKSPDPRTTDDKFLMEIIVEGDDKKMRKLLKETGASEINEKDTDNE